MLDFNILNKPAKEAPAPPVEPEVVETFYGHPDKRDPFDLERLKAELMPYKAEVGKMLATARAHNITDAESNELAVTYGTQAQKLLKEINAAATKIKGPYAKIVNGINSVTKPFRDDLAGIKDNLRAKISAYRRQQAELERRIAAKKAAEEKKRLEAEAEKERQLEIARQEQARRDAEKLQAELDAKAKAENVEPVKVDIPEVVDPGVAAPIVENVGDNPDGPIRTESGTASVVKKWGFKPVDFSKIPDKYIIKTLNKKVVKEAIDAGVREIPGIDIYPDDTVRFRSK